ncbi:MAG: hypothetical protein HY236_16870 [Acidobacteria bacterium]|nr:hypothetical protein [Acidobacteriota bacterium]
MKARMLLGVLLGASMMAGADSAPAPVTAKTEDLEITARLITDQDAQMKAVGSDLKRQYVIVELMVKPRGGYPVTLSRDDFLLRSERDNERGTADSPERVAGGAVLVLGETGGGSVIRSESGDPVFIGGIPGTGGGMPRRIGQNNGVGSSAAPSTTTVAASTAKETPLLATLREKELPLGEKAKPVTGFLYFPVNPKQKTKNFHLHYRGPGGSCELRFK